MKAFFDKIDAPSAIAITLIVAVVALMFVLVFHGVPDSNVFNLVVGSMLTLAGTIVTFYFGSSSGSKDKDKASADTLKGAVRALSDNQTPGNGNGGVKAALALFAVLCLLSFAMPAMAQTAAPAKHTPAASSSMLSDRLPLGDPRPSCQNGVSAPGAVRARRSGTSAARTAIRSAHCGARSSTRICRPISPTPRRLPMPTSANANAPKG